MRKTARPVVWEGAGAQSPVPGPIRMESAVGEASLEGRIRWLRWMDVLAQDPIQQAHVDRPSWVTTPRSIKPVEPPGSFVLGALTMPFCCLVMAHRPSCYPLFAIPVLSLATAATATLCGLVGSFL